MRYSVTFEGIPSAGTKPPAPDQLDASLDLIMEHLAAEPGTDPAIGATGATGSVEIGSSWNRRPLEMRLRAQRP